MSDTMRRFSRPPTGRGVGGRSRELRELIFSDLHPAYRSLRDKSNVLSADEAMCQEQKELVKEYDAQLKSLFDPRKPSEEPRTTAIREARAEAIEKIKNSKRRRSALIIELSQAQQVWEMVNRPSQPELEVLSDRLEQEFKEYWKRIEAERPSMKGKTPLYRTDSVDLADPVATTEDEAKTPGGTEHLVKPPETKDPSMNVESRAIQHHTPATSRVPSLRSIDITSVKARSRESLAPQTQPTTTPMTSESELPASPTSTENERQASPILSLESMVDRVNGTMRTGRDHLGHVLRSIGNLRQRRRKSD